MELREKFLEVCLIPAVACLGYLRQLGKSSGLIGDELFGT